MLGEPENQSSLTRAAFCKRWCRKSNFLSVSVTAAAPGLPAGGARPAEVRSRSARLRCALLALVSLVVFTDCATYPPGERPTVTSNDLLKQPAGSFKSETCEVQLLVLNDKRLAKSYVGIDPVATSMLPVFIKLTNSGKEPMKVDILGSVLQTCAGDLCAAISIEEAVARARRSDAEVVGWGIGFGIIGWIASSERDATANRSLEEDYHSKCFKPSLVNSMSSGEGLVFFNVPASKQPLINAVVIQLRNLVSNDTIRLTVKL